MTQRRCARRRGHRPQAADSTLRAVASREVSRRSGRSRSPRPRPAQPLCAPRRRRTWSIDAEQRRSARPAGRARLRASRSKTSRSSSTPSSGAVLSHTRDLLQYAPRPREALRPEPGRRERRTAASEAPKPTTTTGTPRLLTKLRRRVTLRRLRGGQTAFAGRTSTPWSAAARARSAAEPQTGTASSGPTTASRR